MDVELKPCPFCGCQMFVGKLKDEDRIVGYVMCHEFQTEPCIISQPSTAYATSDLAIEAWNKRCNRNP